MRRQGPPGHPLALLDVLCCGLGAAVMLLMLVRQAPSSVDWEARTQRAQGALLAAQAELRDRMRILGESEGARHRAQLGLERAESALKAAASAVERSAEAARSAGEAADADAMDLRKLLDEDGPSENPPPPPKQLTGLRMAPDRALVLLDRSASMMHRNVVDVVRLRASPLNAQLAARKWRTARDAAAWAVERIPQGGRRRLLAFAEGVAGVDAPVSSPLRWVRQGDPVKSAEELRRGMDGLVPHGATNLKGALQSAAKLSPPPRQVLIITDGLPTLPGDSPLRTMRSCPKARGPRSPIVSGDCRLSIFLDAAQVAEQRLAGTRFDVILLPLEGDAQASRAYWLLSALSGGRMLSPAFGWPSP